MLLEANRQASRLRPFALFSLLSRLSSASSQKKKSEQPESQSVQTKVRLNLDPGARMLFPCQCGKLSRRLSRCGNCTKQKTPLLKQVRVTTNPPPFGAGETILRPCSCSGPLTARKRQSSPITSHKQPEVKSHLQELK